MDLTELQIHIEEIQWDEDFQLFYERASSGNPDYVFDLYMVNYLDHNCTMKGIDFELLTYCALNGHSLATELSNAYSGGFSEEDKHKMLAYYKDKSTNDGLLLWILGLCYECFGFESQTFISLEEYENATGRKCFVDAFECYKKSADLDFPLGLLYAYLYCYQPEGKCISYVKESETLLSQYGEGLKKCGITWPLE